MARKRCWRFGWVLDSDIKGFFDNIDHDLVLRALRHHTGCLWLLLYIERWLRAPVQLETAQSSLGIRGRRMMGLSVLCWPIFS